MYYDDQRTLQAQGQAALAATLARDTQSFRETLQGKHTTKEWDLNRPDGLRLDQPARVGDDDPRCGPSSLQRFDGEDLSAGERHAAQVEQLKAWWAAQAAAKDAERAEMAGTKRADDQLALYQGDVQREVAAAEAAARREMNQATLDENRRLAEEKRAAEEEAKAAELAATMAELDATMASPMLNEDPLTATSTLSPFRVRKDHWKGMSETEKRAILETQLRQMAEAKAKRAAEAAAAADHARKQAAINKAMLEQAARVEQFKREQASNLADRLKAQMEEKRSSDRARDELYAGKIAPEYFGQFGTSHR